MKKVIGKIIVIFSLAIALTSCETLDEIFSSIKGDGAKTSGDTKKTTVVSKGYNLPESYETAYSYRTDKPYDIAKKIPKNIDALRTTKPADYVKEICVMIDESAKNDFEKAKMAHDVIAILVSYDAANYWSGTVPDQSWENVLKTKLAVCEGYANTYKKFCDTLGIKCEKVSGYARGVGYDISQAENPSNSNHAWNIVQLDGAWYLVDVTWDSGYMSGKKSVQSYNTDWLFTKPIAFLHSHYPTKKTHQLMETSISADEFCKLPYLRPKYFDIAKNSSVEIGMKNNAENSFVLEYDSNDDYTLSFNVSDEKWREIENCVLQENSDGRVTTTINFPKAGLYRINLFAFKRGAKSGSGVGEFFVETSSDNDVLFPKIYGTDNSLNLISPKTMPLNRGDTYTFKVYAPTKNFVAIIDGKNFTQMEKDEDGYFTLDYEISNTAKSITIGSSQKKTGSYASFAVFKVE